MDLIHIGYGIILYMKTEFNRKGDLMLFSLLFLAILFTDAAMAAFVFMVIREKSSRRTFRLIAATMGISYIFAGVQTVVSGAGYMIFIMCLIGFMLSYTSFVFTVSR